MAQGNTRCCERCQSTNNLRLKDSITIWREGLAAPQRVNFYVCVDLKACSERVNELRHFLREPDLWANYDQECRPRRYTPRKYWNNGHRLTFAIAQLLFLEFGLTLEKGRPDFPQGLKSGYIINRTRRYTSLLKAIELLDEEPKKAKRSCRRNLNSPAGGEIRL
jgi:hypothetical protein